MYNDAGKRKARQRKNEERNNDRSYEGMNVIEKCFEAKLSTEPEQRGKGTRKDSVHFVKKRPSTIKARPN